MRHVRLAATLASVILVLAPAPLQPDYFGLCDMFPTLPWCRTR